MRLTHLRSRSFRSVALSRAANLEPDLLLSVENTDSMWLLTCMCECWRVLHFLGHAINMHRMTFVTAQQSAAVFAAAGFRVHLLYMMYEA